MSGVNKVIIVGNLGNDPESRTFPDGGTVCNISVATSEKWKDKTTGQDQERTEWHRIVGRNRLAEIMGQYLRKGSKVYIEGKLQTRKWTDSNGQEKYTTEIHAMQMQMLDGRQGGSEGQQQAQPQARPQAQPQQTQQTQQPQPQQSPDNYDDDIPF